MNSQRKHDQANHRSAPVKRPKFLARLSKELKREFVSEIIRRDFSGWAELSEWLKDRGVIASKSTLHRYGQKLKQRYESIDKEIEDTGGIASRYLLLTADLEGGEIAGILQDLGRARMIELAAMDRLHRLMTADHIIYQTEPSEATPASDQGAQRA